MKDIISSGIYVDHFTAANGCDSMRTLNLTVKPSVATTVDQDICEGQSYLNYSASGTYVDHFTAVNGCDSSRTLHLTVKVKSHTSIEQTICDGQSNSGHTTAGTYTDIFPAANGCDSIRVLKLNVLPKPSPDLGSDRELCLGENLTITPGVFDSYLWQDLSTLDHLTVAKTGIYSVTVTNSCGSTSDQIVVTNKVCQTYFPNSFTPNNDGKNDIFRILYEGINLQKYELQIFDRYGKEIFISRNVSEGWDGKYKTVNCNQGVYVWSCSFKKSGLLTNLKGTVILLR